MEYTFASPQMLILGLLAGILFGFFLRKGHLCRFDVIVGLFLFKDFTVIRVMLTAIIVGSIGIYGMLDLGWMTELPVKPLYLWGILIGGGIFGVGMSLLGLCPGTCVVAMGEGAIHAFWGFLGMLVGSAIYAEIYDYVKPTLLDSMNLGNQTIPEVTLIPAWVFIAFLIVAAVILFSILKKIESKKS